MESYKDKCSKYENKLNDQLVQLAGFSFKHKQNNDNKFRLPVRDPYLFMIQTGKKTIEGRKGNANKYKDWVGHIVIFFNQLRSIPVRVKEIRHYPDLQSYLKKEDYKKVLPDPSIKSFDDAVDAYHKFYSDEDIKKSGGMVAIEVELV